jgi:hypothetical protein
MDDYQGVGGIFVVNPETGEPERVSPAADVVENIVTATEAADDSEVQPTAAARRVRG